MSALLQRTLDARPVRIAAAGLACLAVVYLFWLGRSPGAVNLFEPPWDKVAHFTVFAGITGLFAIGLGARGAFPAMLIVWVVGLADELHQATLRGRSADWSDWLVDAAAAGLAAAVLTWMRARR
jgi:VanZ family protein